MTLDAAAVATAELVTQAVECVDLSYQFAAHLAVDHVNLSIAPGEMYGLDAMGLTEAASRLADTYSGGMIRPSVNRPELAEFRHSLTLERLSRTFTETAVL